MKLFYFLFPALVFFSCTPPAEKKEQPIASVSPDSIKNNADSQPHASVNKTDSLPKDSSRAQVAKETPAPKEQPKKNENLFYYSGSQKISAMITPWKNRKRKIVLYDLSGRETFTQEDVQRDYQVTTTLEKFYANGAVQQLSVHENPGGSRYWYETTITFDTQNVPLTKEVEQLPADRPDGPTTFTWDATTQSWKKVSGGGNGL